MERFTADEALDEMDGPEAVLLTTKRARIMIEREHGCSWEEFASDCPHLAAAPLIDAGRVLAWLGY